MISDGSPPEVDDRRRRRRRLLAAAVPVAIAIAIALVVGLVSVELGKATGIYNQGEHTGRWRLRAGVALIINDIMLAVAVALLTWLASWRPSIPVRHAIVATAAAVGLACALAVGFQTLGQLHSLGGEWAIALHNALVGAGLGLVCSVYFAWVGGRRAPKFPSGKGASGPSAS